MTYSGRCLLSNFMAERGANQGSCANSCRWKYKVHLRLNDGTIKPLELTEENMDLFEFLLEEENRPGELMPIEEDDRGSYILNAKDLCILPKLEDYLRIGVDSLKVEGRGKSLYYVAVVARAYRQAIDDWYRDPDGWSPKPYMDDLATVANRGYTYAFHEGRLTNHAHGFDHTGTLAEWEFAGMVHSVEDDCFLVEVKNRLEAGDVLEFLSPTIRYPLRLRLYEFEDVKSGKVSAFINAGPKPLIRVPFSVFEHEDLEVVKTHFPPMSVIRKERALSQEEWDRLRADDAAHRVELGLGSEATYAKRRDALQASIEESEGTKERPRAPRFGVEGCCGKGCNGCLVFWHDPTYSKARDLLAQKKQGEKLEKGLALAP
jgi:putative protease